MSICTSDSRPDWSGSKRDCSNIADYKALKVQNLTGQTLPKVTAKISTLSTKSITNMPNNTTFNFCFSTTGVNGFFIDIMTLGNTKITQTLLNLSQGEFWYHNYNMFQIFCIRINNRMGKNGQFLTKIFCRHDTQAYNWYPNNYLYCDNNGDILYAYPIYGTSDQARIYFKDAITGIETEVIGNEGTPYINNKTVTVNSDFSINCASGTT